ncbi:XrtA/PEP-CTERM system histidine kinase PrsK [Roseateles sp.]|uniref:XrtA/PEP-CTERM system histidine kinase PrsK n=1 Tax=Roseateles sp. TaxID=1971397 RepID=UPI00396473A0
MLDSLDSAGFLFSALSYAALLVYAVQRLLREPTAGRSGAAIFWLLAILATALWAALGAVNAELHWSARLPGWVVPLADLARYALWFVFIGAVLRPTAATAAGARKGVPWIWPVAGGAVALQGGLIAWAQTVPNGTLDRQLAFAALGLAVLGLALLEQLLRNSAADARWNARPVCLGLGLTFSFDLFIFSLAALFERSDAELLSVRGLVHALAMPLLAIASRRQADWFDRLHISRAAVFHSATLLLVGGYLLMVAGVGYYVRYSGGSLGRALSVAVVFVALVGLAWLALSGTVRSRLRVYISKNFFSYRYDYREEWLGFNRLLSQGADSQTLGETVVRALANLVESPSGAIWSLNVAGTELRQTVAWNLPRQFGAERLDDSLASFLSRTGWIILLDDLRHDASKYPELQAPAWLTEDAQHWLVLPLVSGNSLTGFAVLGRPRVPIEVDWEVRDLLLAAASQAAGYLRQAQALEALLEARKFEAFNRMSAFVVHDLKNIVTQLSLMLRNAKRLRDNPEFQQDMLDTVDSAVEKMRQLMLQLREGEKPHGVTSGVDLAELARRLQNAARLKGRELQLHVASAVSTRGHTERLERVLGHMVQNAFDATPPDGEVAMWLDAQGSQARVRIIDTGCGMTEDFIQNRLFKPFQTTKTSGMGIGAHESHQYVQELGGSIQVESTVNKGTSITLLLPLFHAQSEASGLERRA